jgi:multidrug resistance efflux pump
MTIHSLRSHGRPDNLKNQVRPGQSLARRIYLGSLLLGAGWIVTQFVGSMIFMDADGLVVQQREVVTPAYAAQVVSVAVSPGEAVRKGQRIGTVASAQMLDLISDLSMRHAQARSRQEQIKARLEAIQATLPIADQRAGDAAEAMRAVDKAKAGGFSTVMRQAEASQERYAAMREAASLRVEATALKSERGALDGNVARITAALDKATQTYRDGMIIAPVDGIVGPKVVASGTVLSPGDNFTEIHYGEKYVIAYLPTSRFYSIDSGEQVVITDGVNRQSGHIQRVEGIADKLPAEFQSGFRSIDRQQVVRVSVDDPAVFPLLTKIKVMHAHAPSNLLGEARSYIAEALTRAVTVTVATAAPLLNRVSPN